MKRARIHCVDYSVGDLRYRFIQNEAWENAVAGARIEGAALRGECDGQERSA